MLSQNDFSRLQGVWRPKEQPDSFSAELHQQEDHYPVDISWWAKEVSANTTFYS